ncbi:peroxidase 46-like [Arachis stenosperma]|uniref:peroxidase 46-like n=1 Tax=Arachis stenosperma TaxID=217475 RepID=UPI0025AC6936|nr:peroxidase 46-like [Arachis stenosperma]
METTRAVVFTNIIIAVSSLFIVVLFLVGSVSGGGSLFFNFYGNSCPAVEFVVRNAVTSSSSSDPSIPGKLLRLLFHDCFVEGCDASLMLRGNNTELSDPANRSIGGLSVIDLAKRDLEMLCPETVSCADIIALAARDAVAITGGPMIPIPTGRRDGVVSVVSNVRPNIVDTSFTMDQMINLFSTKGLSLIDLLVLSGAHTIGAAHCSSIRSRFQETSNGKFTLIDKTLDSNYANDLIQQCPTGVSPSVTVNNDPETSLVFDNQYYRNLMNNKGLFPSDSALLIDGRTRKLVEDLANDQQLFFESWGQSFLKLTSIGVKTGDEGQIRRFCGATN